MYGLRSLYIFKINNDLNVFLVHMKYFVLMVAADMETVSLYETAKIHRVNPNNG